MVPSDRGAGMDRGGVVRGFSEAGGAVCGDGAADSAVVPVLQGRGALG